jgi:DHA1 family tetracycline resistance protein-like MFS transporter
MASQVMWVFVMVARFGWPTAEVGVVLAASSLIGAVVSGRVSGPFVRRLGVRHASIVCAFAGVASLTGFGLVPAGWLILPCMVAWSAPPKPDRVKDCPPPRRISD